MSQTRLAHLIKTANIAFKGQALYSNVRLPNPSIKGNDYESEPFVQVPALWTRDGLRPLWNNLAAVAAAENDKERITWWSKFLNDLAIPLGLLSFKDLYILLSSTPSDKSKVQEVSSEHLHTEIERYSDSLFTPRSLSSQATGQFSFADLEESITAESFSFHFRHRAHLGKALKKAIDGALDVEVENRNRSSQELITEERAYIASKYNDVLMVAIAFLAARILEDKGFFGHEQMPTNNPGELLRRTVLVINGFFREAFNDNLPQLSYDALQSLAYHLGARANFTLIDHRDVAQLYEQAIQILPASLLEKIDYRMSLLNLQRHYTPVAIAGRMLERLPIERLRPEERRIFDPAAGSGSLLLASTLRLAAMPDVPIGQTSYLADHVAGNDLDRLARLITQLRYSLIQESLGRTELFPTPLHFENRDFETYTKDTLPNRPRVIVANPPFAEDQALQRAVKFIELVTDWLNDDDQFAFILPQSFLSGSTHGFPKARKTLASRCHIFEAWQLPEGVIGLTAQQPVCVVLGTVGRKTQVGTLAHAILTRAKKNAIRNQGFLGPAWLTAVGKDTEDWTSLAAPQIEIPVPTIPLGALYVVFNGVVPNKNYPPVGEKPEGIKVKPFWKLSWKEPGRLWADPERVDPAQRYIRYGAEFLVSPRLQREALFNKPKVFVGRSTNRGSKDPLVAHLDTKGLCPNNHIYCICSFEQMGKVINNANLPARWTELNITEQLLWLLGILSSNFARDLVLRMQDARQLVADRFREFELPAQVDLEIIRIVGEMVSRDQRRELISDPDPLREALNLAVEASYGNPKRVPLERTGPLPELDKWKRELSSPANVVAGQVLEFSPKRGEIYLYLDGILDDVSESWIPLPPELPGWALDGQVFTAALSEDVETFAEIARRPWALRHFRHTPRPYLTIDELEEQFASIKQSENHDL